MSEFEQIWGYCLRLVGFNEAEKGQVHRSFHGSCETQKDIAGRKNFSHCYTISLHRTNLLFANSVNVKKVRHRAGSDVRKVLLDGSAFDPQRQNRHVSAIYESPGISLYDDTNGCIIIATPCETAIFGQRITMDTILDTIENLIMCRAYEDAYLHVHASAWVKPNGKATLVIGDSGFGKTTALLENVKRGCKFLSSDRAFVRRNEGRLEARGFPLPMNIGVGTIKALRLDLPIWSLADQEKIRLTAHDVCLLFQPEYYVWFEIDQIICRSPESLLSNMYFAEDPSHPFWNYSVKPVKAPQSFDSIKSCALNMVEHHEVLSEKQIAT